jgi:alkaline phosphatase D
VQIPVSNLKSGKRYQLKLEARLIGRDEVSSIEGSFKTADNKESILPVFLATATCQYFWNFDDKDRGFKTYDSMRRLNPGFFIHTGDYVYYDRIGPLATTIEKARHKWHAMDSWKSIKEFYQHVPVYLLKDDHDLLKNDVTPDSSPLGEFSLDDGLKVWRENVPLKNKPYRTFRWGKDLQVWLVEGREYRSSTKNNSSEGTIWGEEQKSWFQSTVDASDATFKILFSPTPVVGPDRENKKDNHANKIFSAEGNWLRGYLSKEKDFYVVNGDRHWQYFSIDEETGLKEFGAGPVSDAQAGGWAEDDFRPEHQFLRVKGGFLGMKIYRENNIPYISFTHYDVDGKVVNEALFHA